MKKRTRYFLVHEVDSVAQQIELEVVDEKSQELRPFDGKHPEACVDIFLRSPVAVTTLPLAPAPETPASVPTSAPIPQTIVRSALEQPVVRGPANLTQAPVMTTKNSAMPLPPNQATVRVHGVTAPAQGQPGVVVTSGQRVSAEDAERERKKIFNQR